MMNGSNDHIWRKKMTKAELIEALKGFPDDLEVRIGVKEYTCAYSIERLDKFCNEFGKVDNFITLEPGDYYGDGE